MTDSRYKAVSHFVESANKSSSTLDKKIFNDPIHGHIDLHPLLVKVIDTPQFQRLRNIKQLGGNYFVYPGASHNRFEHCIGTCHLAGKLARHLKEIHPKLVDERDVLCVELAGLCHDLGHGPFSHMFDMKFLPKASPGSNWMHEEGSCAMFDYLIQDNELEDDFQKYGLKLPDDMIFIKEMIYVPKKKSDGLWHCMGRGENKSFLYEIVSNERNKVDVDKWDYFARDCYHLGIKNSFDHNRFMKFLKVLTVEGEYPQLCARDKESLNLYEMFHTRSALHRRAYQHRVSTAVELMICDALLLANNHIKFKGKDNKMLTISEAVTDMVAFSKLSDNIFFDILYSIDDCDNIKAAQTILKRILKRDLYRFVGKCKLPKGKFITVSSDEIEDQLASFDDDVTQNDIAVNIKKYNYGMNNRNPCDHFCFYSKQNPNVSYHIRREDISHMLPETFEDCEIQVFCKMSKKKVAVNSCFLNWCNEKGYKPPNAIEVEDSSLTPMKPSLKYSFKDNQKVVSGKKLKFN